MVNTRHVIEVFLRFLALGLMSFGGPAAHIGYFQHVFVQRLQWLDEQAYARLVALSQFLPGPGSSQIGFAIGLKRAGLFGALAAFIGFTLPSFFLLYLLAVVSPEYAQEQWFAGAVHGLKLLAVVVVADACINMYRSFCRDAESATIAVIVAAVLLIHPSLFVQLSLLALAASIGVFLGKGSAREAESSQGLSWFPLVLFALGFIGLPVIALQSEWLGLINAFFQSGSLVFGGGHVVLPLLQQSVGDLVSSERFLMGYAAAQGVPGPMFTLSAFLGAEMMPASAFWGALLATLAIFLPGFLLLLGLINAWEGLAAKPRVAGAIWGVNAAVVGLLLSALYQPVFSTSVNSTADMAVVLLGLFVLHRLKLPIMALVACFALFGLLSGLIFQ